MVGKICRQVESALWRKWCHYFTPGKPEVSRSWQVGRRGPRRWSWARTYSGAKRALMWRSPSWQSCWTCSYCVCNFFLRCRLPSFVLQDTHVQLLPALVGTGICALALNMSLGSFQLLFMTKSSLICKKVEIHDVSSNNTVVQNQYH